ncbi:MAG: hypothetical protein K2N49_00865 [Ruminococcus sp.]|nr:hypothetical protein [Ruminococcus sp.]MDE7225404.1 hypothetical protein [Ruminococcus sp.]
MKRLKHRHLFHGKSLPVIFSLFWAFLVIIILFTVLPYNIESDMIYLYLIAGSLAIILLTLAVDYAVIHHLKPDEKKKITEASPLEWKKLPDRMKKKFQFNKKDYLILTAAAIGLELIIAFFIMLSDGMETMLVSLAVIIPATLICLAIYAVYEYIWANMDDSAIYAEIEVDHSFDGERTRGGRKKFIVFYLPDGKYVLELTCRYPVPKNIVIIKYKSFIRWENADKFI